MTDPAADIMRLINGYQVSQAQHVAAVLEIPDLLVASPRTSEDLAQATVTHPESLYRLLRALAAIGVLREEAERLFSLMPMGHCLRADGTQPAGP